VGHATPKRVEALVGLTVSQIACGSRHTAVVTHSGALYTWGDKENGVTGHGDTEGHQYTPKLLERLAGKRVVELSACGFHTGCLTEAKELFTWGEGKFGRLGHNCERNCHTPRLVETLIGKNPCRISCGGFHTAAVTEDGNLYTFGGGEHGQLGHNDRMNKLKPTIVQALDGVFISQITCGWSHSVALTAKVSRVVVSVSYYWMRPPVVCRFNQLTDILMFQIVSFRAVFILGVSLLVIVYWGGSSESSKYFLSCPERSVLLLT
jgi:RCC1 and BTB domain-containing protein